MTNDIYIYIYIYIYIKFGIAKCGISAMKMRKEVECNGMELENGEGIGKVGGEGYKYLSVLEKGDICQEEIKENFRKEYFERLRATLKSKLNARHVFQGITHGWCQLFDIALLLLNVQRRK